MKNSKLIAILAGVIALITAHSGAFAQTIISDNPTGPEITNTVNPTGYYIFEGPGSDVDELGSLAAYSQRELISRTNQVKVLRI